MTRISGCLLLLFGSFFPGRAQEARLIDSLQRIYTKTSSDTTRILILTEVAKNFYRSNPDTAIQLGNQAVTLSEKISFDKGIARGYNVIGLGNWITGNHMEALTYFQKGLLLFTKINDKIGMGFILNNIGLVYYYQKDFHTAMEYAIRALEVHQALNNPEGIGLALNNIGLDHEGLGNLTLALEYYQRGLKTFQDAKIRMGIGQSFTDIGYVYYAQKDYSRALKFLNQGMVIQLDVNDQSTLISSLIGISLTHLALKEYVQCIAYGEQALKRAEEIKIAIDAQEASHVLFLAYQEKKDYEKALDYFQLHKQLSDSIFGIEKTKAISTLQASIALTEKQKELEIAHLERAKQQRITILMVGSLLLVGTLAFIIFLNRRRLQQAYHKLEITNSDLNASKSKIEVQAEMLTMTNKANEKIFSIVSHDLRSPLLSLKGLFALLENNQLSGDEFVKLIPDLTKRLQHASDITEELLHWSRNQMDIIEMKPVSVEILPLFQKKVDRFSQSAKDKGINFQIKVEDEQLHFFADMDMIKTVLRNLIANAIKFCRKADTITLAAILQNSDVKISVTDTGTGISDEDFPKIFSQQGFSTYGTSGEKGTGLGLILCKEFVEKNGGRMWVESVPGVGSTFSFTLPKS